VSLSSFLSSFIALPLLALSLAAGCGDDSTPPLSDSGATDGGMTDSSTPDSGAADAGCEGCLDGTGACISGDQLEACGAAGMACIACNPGESCAEGQCLAPPGCDETSCAGCCMGDACVETPLDSACGSGGGECTTCESPATCRGGSCQLPCDEFCDGCCDGETCVAAADINTVSCGVDGATCTMCGDEEACDGGVCVDIGCASTCAGCCDGSTCIDPPTAAACGLGGSACFGCGTRGTCSGEGRCEVDPETLWDVTVLDAVVPELNGEGGAWDPFGGLPDPYITGLADSGAAAVTGQSTPRGNTLMPAWPEIFLTGVRAGALLGGGLSVGMYDDDYDADDTIGACLIPADAIRLGSPFGFVCRPAPPLVGFEVRLRIEPTP